MLVNLAEATDTYTMTLSRSALQSEHRAPSLGAACKVKSQSLVRQGSTASKGLQLAQLHRVPAAAAKPGEQAALSSRQY
jgi:hypothetical protein